MLAGSLSLYIYAFDGRQKLFLEVCSGFHVQLALTSHQLHSLLQQNARCVIWPIRRLSIWQCIEKGKERQAVARSNLTQPALASMEYPVEIIETLATLEYCMNINEYRVRKSWL